MERAVAGLVVVLALKVYSTPPVAQMRNSNSRAHWDWRLIELHYCVFPLQAAFILPALGTVHHPQSRDRPKDA